MVWGGSWAIRRETFEQLKIHETWAGMLSDDLVASNQLRRSGLEVRFDPACVLTSPVDFDWAGMFDFVRRQYHITRHYAFRWWLLALAAATAGNLAWIRFPGVVGRRDLRTILDGMAAGKRAYCALRAGALPWLGHAEPG